LNEAAILTARRNKSSITMAEVNTAIDRVIAGLEGSPLTDTKNKRLVAYHEIGHAIIGSLLKYHDNVQKVTLIPRGQARGLTWFTPNEDQALVSRGQLVARIIGSLGGRAAEEVVFGSSEITTGASNDIQQVTSLARQMVTRFGMSTVGPISLDSGGGQVFLGRGMDSGNELSNAVADKIDDQVKIIVKHCYDQAISIIKENRIIMDQLVDKLIQDETIEGDAFREVVATYTNIPSKFGHEKKNLMQKENKNF
jgi:cell division protease FtsH